MDRTISINGKRIGDDTDCYVIAEVGHNHQGKLETAKELIRQAKECGADAVKLQKRDNLSLYTRAMYDRPYEHENSYGRTYGEHREFLELDGAEYEELRKYANSLGIHFFATAFDVPSADMLHDLGVPAFKIASGDLRNLPLLRHVASLGLPMIVSTGGATIEDVDRAVKTIRPINPQLAVLQCTAAYPAPFEQLDLRVIETYRQRYPESVVGLSAHDSGIAMGPVAYALGARVIEKHFTLNRAMKGTDHAFSLEPVGLRKLVRDLQRVRAALGDGVKKRFPNEAEPIRKMGKSIYAARALPAGQILTPQDLALRSPADWAPAFQYDQLLGKRLLKPLQADDPVLPELVEAVGPVAVEPSPEIRTK